MPVTQNVNYRICKEDKSLKSWPQILISWLFSQLKVKRSLWLYDFFRQNLKYTCPCVIPRLLCQLIQTQSSWLLKLKAIDNF